MQLCPLTQLNIETARQCPLFLGFSAADFSQILRMGGVAASYDKGERVDIQNTLPIVLVGRGVIRRKQTSGGPEVLLDDIAPPRAVGLATLFLENTILSDIFAKDSLKLLLFSKQEIEAMLDAFPVFRRNYISYLSGRIAFLTKKIERFTDHSAENRLFTFVREKADPAGNLSVSSFKDLALSLNIGRASLYRSLDNLREQGLIKTDGHNITLIKPD